MYFWCMSKVALKIKNYSASEIKSMLRKDERFQQGVRLYACYQVALGKRPQELEDIYDTSFKSICNWVNRFNQGGVEALIDKPKSGRISRLDESQLENVKEIVMNTMPSAFGFNSATWTGPLLSAWIKQEYGVTYKKAQIYNILHSLGLTFQKGKGIYPEAKEREEKVGDLKKTASGKRKG